MRSKSRGDEWARIVPVVAAWRMARRGFVADFVYGRAPFESP